MRDLGECSFDSADDSNIPVDIWLTKAEPEDVEDDIDDFEEEDAREGGLYDESEAHKPDPSDLWTLKAANYCPRKGEAYGGAFRAVGTREELTLIIKTRIIPLYQTALKVLEGMVAGTEENLYYWQESCHEVEAKGDDS